jgi:porphobilinogen synthase
MPVQRISDVVMAYAEAGTHYVAPSDMNDGRVRAIKLKLIEAGIAHRANLMPYSAKFSGCLYGPFRDVAGSCPSFNELTIHRPQVNLNIFYDEIVLSLDTIRRLYYLSLMF